MGFGAAGAGFLTVAGDVVGLAAGAFGAVEGAAAGLDCAGWEGEALGAGVCAQRTAAGRSGLDALPQANIAGAEKRVEPKSVPRRATSDG